MALVALSGIFMTALWFYPNRTDTQSRASQTAALGCADQLNSQSIAALALKRETSPQGVHQAYANGQ